MLRINSFIASFLLFLIASDAQSAGGDLDRLVELLRDNIKTASSSGAVRRDGTLYHFSATAENGYIRLVVGSGGREIRVPIDQTKSTVEIVGRETKMLQDQELQKLLSPFGLSLDELTLRFLFWPKYVEVPAKIIQKATCTGIQFLKEKDGQLAESFVVWVDEKSGVPYEIRSRDAVGHDVTKMDIVSVQKSGTNWRVRSIRISHFASRKTDYIDIDPM